MFSTIKRQKLAQVLLISYVLFIIWWLTLQNGDNLSTQNQLFGALYGLIALYGGLIGVFVARKWSFANSIMGKAILMFAFGLFAQEFGQLIYSYYTFFTSIEVPYPSLGDLGYFGSIPFYIYGVILLARASVVKVSLKSVKNQIQAIIIPIVVLCFSYYVFLQGYEFDWTQPIAVLLDFGYPLGQAVYVSLAFLTYLLSRKTLGGVMKDKILFILFALLIQYLADYTFLFLAYRGEAYPGGIIDLLYLTSYFLMALGLLGLRVSEIKAKLKN